MRARRLRDAALLLLFSVGLPLAAGGWWRYLSGYDHPRESGKGPAIERGTQEQGPMSRDWPGQPAR